jgi:antitoxin HicB
MKTKASQKPYLGSDSRDFLAGEGILPEVKALALKRVISRQLQQILQHEPVTKTELASRIKTSRASLDRMLDLSKPSPTVASLGKAAAALGWKVELRFVPV